MIEVFGAIIAFSIALLAFLSGAVTGFYAGRNDILSKIKMPDYIDEEVNQ